MPGDLQPQGLYQHPSGSWRVRQSEQPSPWLRYILAAPNPIFPPVPLAPRLVQFPRVPMAPWQVDLMRQLLADAGITEAAFNSWWLQDGLAEARQVFADFLATHDQYGEPKSMQALYGQQLDNTLAEWVKAQAEWVAEHPYAYYRTEDEHAR